jgi:hypothetical protein
VERARAYNRQENGGGEKQREGGLVRWRQGRRTHIGSAALCLVLYCLVLMAPVQSGRRKRRGAWHCGVVVCHHTPAQTRPQVNDDVCESRSKQPRQKGKQKWVKKKGVRGKTQKTHRKTKQNKTKLPGSSARWRGVVVGREER